MPRVPVNKQASLAANTAYPGLVLGTPVTTAIAGNSLVISNTIASGDIVLMANRGGNSEEYIFIDGSAGQLKITSPLDHTLINTVGDSKNVRINSRNYTGTTGDNIAVQIKPAVTVTKTADGLKGLEVSPRVNSGVAMAGASGTVIGIASDVYLKGTATGTIAGDIRALNLEVVTDDAGTRTISGNVNAIRVRAAFSATTISGTMVPIRIEKAEAQTGSQQWDAVLELPSTNTGIWHDTDSDSGDTEAGYIKVLVNGNARYILLYSDAPTL